jgi:hypothetical protein
MTLKYNCALHEVLKNLLPGVVAVIFILKDSFFYFYYNKIIFIYINFI